MEPAEIRELRNRIGRAVRKLREEKGISAKYLAKVLGVTQPTISRIESGTASLSAENLCFLAKSFNYPLSFFVGERSPLAHDNEDIIRAGLVQYGATHLKAKRAIDIKEHYRTYADFLNAALYEVDDARIAAALAATIYVQSASNKIKPIAIITSIQHEQLAGRLLNILDLLREALPNIKRPAQERKRVEYLIDDLSKQVKQNFNATPLIDFVLKSPNDIALFINASFEK